MSGTRWFRAAILGVLAGLIAFNISLRQDLSRTWHRGQRSEDVYYLPPEDWLPVMSLHYHSALADLLWMKSLLYFGEQTVQRGETKYLFGYVDAIVALDPNFRAIYQWVAMAGLYHSGTVTLEDGYRVVDYLERAVDRWPDDGELAWELGATLRFELAPLIKDPVEKNRMLEAAMEPLETAARLGAGPRWLAGLNAQLLRKLGHAAQAIRHLEEMYDTVDSESEREQMQLQLARLKSESYATAFRAAVEQLEESRTREFPYLSTNMFLLVGDKISSSRKALLQARHIPPLPDFAGDGEFLTE
jgi:hypothetical protein